MNDKMAENFESDETKAPELKLGKDPCLEDKLGNTKVGTLHGFYSKGWTV